MCSKLAGRLLNYHSKTAQYCFFISCISRFTHLSSIPEPLSDVLLIVPEKLIPLIMILISWWPLTGCSSQGRPRPPQWEQSGERDLSSWTFLTFFIKTCWKKWFRISACSKHNCAKPATCTLTFSIIMHSFGRYKVILLQFFTKYYYIVHCINDKRFLLYIYPLLVKVVFQSLNHSIQLFYIQTGRYHLCYDDWSN